jgi:hypothetical protein
MLEAIQQRTTSLITKLELRASGIAKRILSMAATTNIGRVPAQWRGWGPLSGVIVGAVAFGLWWNSISAALFAACGLFYVASVYRVASNATVTLQELTRAVAEDRTGDAPDAAEESDRSDDIRDQAVQRLRPWIADQTSLSEESAKVYCKILLDTLSAVRPALACKQTRGVSAVRGRAPFFGGSPS